MWAKVVNEEIFQTWDEDPTGLWHPDQLVNWEEVPDHVNIGWKRKNNEWISGGQWLEEDQVENPIPAPGPPTAGISVNPVEYLDRTEFIFDANHGGFVDSIEWNIQGQQYTEPRVTLTVNKTSVEQTITVSLTVTGPGGSDTLTLEDETALKVGIVSYPGDRI
jgi:hypothetical protein